MPLSGARTWGLTRSNGSALLTLTAPADASAINSTTMAATWSFNATQDQYRLQVMADRLGASILFDSQWTVSPTQSGSFDLSSAGLVSGGTYYIRLAVHGTNGEWAESTTSFSYVATTSTSVPSDPASFRAIPMPVCDPTPKDNPSIWVIWAEPTTVDGTFYCYEVRRRKAGESDYIPIKRTTPGIPTELKYIDANILSRTEYEYVVVYYSLDGGGNPQASTPQAVPVRASVDFDWIYVHEIINSQTEFIRYPAYGGQVNQVLDIAVSATWGRQKPTTFVGENFYTTISLPGLDLWRKQPYDWNKLKRMMERQSLVGTTLCVRFGFDQQLHFVSLMQLQKALSERSYTSSIQLQEVQYNEDIGPLVLA